MIRITLGLWEEVITLLMEKIKQTTNGINLTIPASHRQVSENYFLDLFEPNFFFFFADANRVKTSSAYVLFYKRVDTNATPAATTTVTPTSSAPVAAVPQAVPPSGSRGKEEEGSSRTPDDDPMMD